MLIHYEKRELTLHNVQCKMYTVHCTVYNAQCTMYIGRCNYNAFTVYIYILKQGRNRQTCWITCLVFITARLRKVAAIARVRSETAQSMY